MKLLCDAIAFCYGPATALKIILSIWKEHFEHITLVATGTTKEYFLRNNLVANIITLDTENPEELNSFDASTYDIYLCVCNPVGYLHLSKKVKKTIYLDFLFWMRTEENAPEFRATQFIAERYPNHDQSVSRFASNIPNFVSIPALIKKSSNSRQPQSNLVILNLGGQRSHLTRPGFNTKYPWLMVECFQSAVDKVGFKGDFIVTSDSQTSSELAVSLSKPQWSFLSLEHDEFLDKLAIADLVITHPGLYSPFESIAMQCPTFFLPSSNYTQILQLQNFRNINMAPWSVDWEDVGCGTVGKGLAEEEGVKKVLKLIDKGNNSSCIRSKLINIFSTWISLPKSDIKKGAITQQNAAAPYLGNYKSTLNSVLKNLLYVS